MANPVLIFCEQRAGQLTKPALEALGEGCRQAAQSGRAAIAVLIGSTVLPLAREVTRLGAERILIAQDACLARYSSELYASILSDVSSRVQPAAIFMAATAMGKDLGPKLAAKLKASLVQDCIAVKMEVDGSVVATRPVYGGKLRAVVKATRPVQQVVSLRPHVFPPPTRTSVREASIETLAPIAKSDRPMALVQEVRSAQDGKVELAEADVIVSGGRGLKAPENFRLVEELAAVLGGAVGASRAAVDAGWKPHSYQVGLTGRTVAPELYIACGISGAIQHQAGMSSARVIVAINNNPHAPIFKLATYGIVGDVFEVLPLLIEELKQRKPG